MTYLLGVLIGLVLVGVLVWSELERRRQHEQTMAILRQHIPAPTPPPEPTPPPWVQDQMFGRIMDRLLNVALPEPAEPTDEVIDNRSDAEYEPPPQQVNDWTDPFFGLDRELVGGLAPGQPIPGIGTDAGVEMPTPETDAWFQAWEDGTTTVPGEPEMPDSSDGWT